jgi:hypothetical protein
MVNDPREPRLHQAATKFALILSRRGLDLSFDSSTWAAKYGSSLLPSGMRLGSSLGSSWGNAVSLLPTSPKRPTYLNRPERTALKNLFQGELRHVGQTIHKSLGCEHQCRRPLGDRSCGRHCAGGRLFEAKADVIYQLLLKTSPRKRLCALNFVDGS